MEKVLFFILFWMVFIGYAGEGFVKGWRKRK